MIECDLCGQTFDDWRGASGHVRFNHDEAGGEGETPDDYRRYFTDKSGESDSEESEESDDSRSSGDADDSGESSEGTESGTDEPTESDDSRGFLSRLLHTPVDELIRGDK
jgi:hypothetical protein